MRTKSIYILKESALIDSEKTSPVFKGPLALKHHSLLLKMSVLSSLEPVLQRKTVFPPEIPVTKRKGFLLLGKVVG